MEGLLIWHWTHSIILTDGEEEEDGVSTSFNWYSLWKIIPGSEQAVKNNEERTIRNQRIVK